MMNWLTQIRTSVLAVFSLALILCGVYPLSVWVLGQAFFPAKANGSLIARDGEIQGSILIGQKFMGPEYFHPRPSAAGLGYDALHSGGSNMGPTSKDLIDTVRRRVAAYREENGLAADAPVPADAVTASASGLDPHISLENAFLQESRVSRARGLIEADVRHEIEALAEGRALGILGEPRVNILILNQALDGARYARK